MKRIYSKLGSILLVAALAGCASAVPPGLVARTTSTPFYTITVNFDADGCPVSVTNPPQGGCAIGPAGICVDRGRAVQWVSDPVGTPFEVYFDPFVGPPYVSTGPDEKTNPAIVRRNAYPGDYKYGVFGIACTGPNPILDPAFRVNP
jgi:hypothetical protein